MKLEGSEYVLAGGRRIHANRGVLGVDPRGDLTNGYDGEVEPHSYRQLYADGAFGPPTEAESPLTDEERAEIADFMIARWTEWSQATWVQQPFTIGEYLADFFWPGPRQPEFAREFLTRLKVPFVDSMEVRGKHFASVPAHRGLFPVGYDPILKRVVRRVG